MVGVARADVEVGARPELQLSVGYDDNLFLDAQPAGPNPAQIRADAIFDVEPRLTGWLLANRHQLTLTLDYLERATASTGDLRDLGIAIGWRSPSLGPFSFFAGNRYEHWATWLYPEDTFDLGGVDAGVRVQIVDRVLVEAMYRFAARAYSDPSRNGQLDLEQRAHALVAARLVRWLKLEVAYGYTHIGSTVASAELDRHRVELALVATPTRWLSLAAGYGIGPQHLPAGLNPAGTNTAPRDDLLQTFDTHISLQPLRWLELFVRYSYLISTSDMPGGQYHRNQFQTGVAARWDFVRQLKPRQAMEPAVRGQSVTFRHRAPPGHRVAVVGDWNGWTAQPMQENRGLYEGTFTIPSGRHEYAFSVDGEVVSPADAPAYVPDGFGGRSGLLQVE